MADITTRVRFVGEAQQLLATYRAIGAEAAALQRSINRVTNARITAPVSNGGLGLQALPSRIGKNYTGPMGAGLKNLQTEIDATNKTFRTFGDAVIRTTDSAGKVIDTFVGQFSEVRGNYDQWITASKRYGQTVEHLSRVEKNRLTGYRDTRQAYRDLIKLETQRARAAVLSINAQQRAGILDAGNARYLRNKEVSRLTSFLADPKVVDARTASLKAYRNELQFVQRVSALRSGRTGAIDSALIAAPPIPASIQQLQRLSPRLLNQLQKSGLGLDAKTLYNQEAFADIEKNLINGTTRINGAFRNLDTGVLQRFSAEIDKNGKLITRWGGQLSGLQNFLNQTVRNLSKVVQWGIATTAVFGGLALATQQLKTIIDLDKNLRQLGVTANLTQDQTRELFGGLADVAQRTATPLAEITKAADDIALAVRGSGKDTKEYTQDILNLTEAVGIYTNLTGEDTVKATDLLTSSMKQLHLQTEDIPALLSKITAVAGGQSTAISDITQGLAVMAEAARQAGLSVDQTIAAVQVLGQVTAKSPSEIATAFKNLVGALDSRAGAKALASFNINLRDGAGNLRNILDIYKEISDKIRQGIIPADEVKGLVKAIAGGPRRAPDAAALLSNIDQIAQAERRSIRASNEALLVNAKVLDTVQAKITQIQVAFDKFAFQTFGKGLADFATTLADGLTTLLKILGSIPSSFITAALQAGLFLAGLRLGLTIIRGVVGQLNGLSLALKETAAAYGTASTAASGFNAAQQAEAFLAGRGVKPPGTGRFAGIKSALLKGGALGFGLGAAVSAVSSGGDIKSSVSGGLTGLGLGLLSIPEPTTLTKIAGVAAIAGSAITSLADNTDKASAALENNAQQAEKVLNAYSKYRDASDTISDLTKVQDDLSRGIQKIQDKNKKNAADLNLLDDLQKQYVQNVITMSNANSELDSSIAEIRQINEPFAALVQGMKTGTVTADQFAAKLRELQLLILKQSNPNAKLPEDIGLVAPRNAPVTPYSGSTTAFIPQREQLVPTPKGPAVRQLSPATSFDLKDLEGKPELVKSLFDKFKDFNATVAPTSENIALISQALRQLREAGDPAAVTMEANFKNWILGASAADAAQLAIAQLGERIKTVGEYDPARGGGLAKLLDLVNKINESGLKRGTATPGAEAIGRLNNIVENNLPLDQQNVQPFITQYARELGAANDKTLSAIDKMTQLRVIVESFSLPWEQFAEAAANAFGVLSEATGEAQKDLQDFADKLTEGAIGNTADLTAQIQSGQFKDDKQGLKKAQADLSYNKQLISSIAEVNAAYQNLQVKVEDLDPVLQSMAGQFATINGLQDAQSLSTEQLIERLFNLADTYGLTGVEVQKLADKVVALIQTVQEVAKIKTAFHIGADVDLSTAIAKLRAIRTAMLQAYTVGGPGGNTTVAGNITGVDDAIATLLNAQKLTTSFNSTFTPSSSNRNKLGVKSSSPSRSGGGRTLSGPDISTLDLPEEIANAANRDALIQQAIKNAKKLQSQIPGASKEGANDIVELLKGTQRILEVRGVKDDLLRRALEELADVEKKRLEFETKADTIRRIRVGAGDFAAIANVPLNSRTGVSVGGSNAINVSLNVNGTILTPAQLQQFADLVGAAIKRQIAA